MSHEIILKIPRNDLEGNEHVLVNISNHGANPLDLKLLATDGSSPYVTSIKHSKIPKLRAKNSPIDETEWESTLISKLCPQSIKDDPQQVDSVQNIQIIAAITGERLTLIFRRNIAGVTQRVGEIPLRLDEEQEISLFEWTATAVDKTSDLKVALRDLNSKYQDQAQIIQKFNDQLEDLIQAKREHENSLMEKFRDLLNAKKLKIRDQQRLLATAKIDPQKAAQIQHARQTQAPRSPEISRSSKRKATTKPQADPESNEEDESDFEKMSIQGEKRDDRQETPSRSDTDVTADEDEDHLQPISRPKSPSGKVKMMEGPGRKEPLSQPPGEMELPPLKELPFAKQSVSENNQPKAAAKTVSVQADQNDDSTTSDDEL